MKYHYFILTFMSFTWLVEEYFLYKLRRSLTEKLNDENQTDPNITQLQKKIASGIRGRFISIKVVNFRIRKLIFYYNLFLVFFFILLLIIILIRIISISLR